MRQEDFGTDPWKGKGKVTAGNPFAGNEPVFSTQRKVGLLPGAAALDHRQRTVAKALGFHV